uniref:uncharacterized protein LOC120344707 n=1 Tax=Styela clava TaxID=7725 RepID=UPI00193A7474|nr:uncharacterized protein LOC120344707 [Styela clava]
MITASAFNMENKLEILILEGKVPGLLKSCRYSEALETLGKINLDDTDTWRKIYLLLMRLVCQIELENNHSATKTLLSIVNSTKSTQVTGAELDRCVDTYLLDGDIIPAFALSYTACELYKSASSPTEIEKCVTKLAEAIVKPKPPSKSRGIDIKKIRKFVKSHLVPALLEVSNDLFTMECIGNDERTELFGSCVYKISQVLYELRQYERAISI